MLESERYSQKYSDDTDSADDDADENDSSRENAVDMRAWRRRLLSTPRVCNSEDDDDNDVATSSESIASSSPGQSSCSKNENDYAEVRLWAQNWEAGFVLSWMMQIIYSELLGVPSTVETGVRDKNVNFYDESNSMGYGKSNDFEFFQRAYDAEGGDCSIYNEANKREAGGDGDGEYIPCAHAVMDVWSTNPDLEDAQRKGVVEPGQFVGMVGHQGWQVTKSSIVNDSSLANIYGIRGRENRRKLADRFKRPTTWKYYCNSISPNNCTSDDGVATRPPAADGSEDGSYFSSGSYTGFFRRTEKNDCDITENCTGHFMDYPCGWSSYVKQQLKHNDVALESNGEDVSGGYSYTSMVEIWNAANATKSDVIGIWWSPDATHNMFRGSGSDLIPVTLPEPTQECVENRVNLLKRCDPSATEFDIYGDEKGACGEPFTSTQKLAVGNMQSNIAESLNPKSRMSPAYDAYKDFSITELQVADILTAWVDRGRDKFGFDLRYATCEWMVENLETVIQSVVPPTHPRAFKGASNTSPLAIVALVFSAITITFTICTVCAMWHKHQKGAIGRAAQIEFLVLLLVGLFLVSIGSLSLALEPSKWTCTGSIWMITIGYTTQLVPTMIRVSAIIKIVRASMKMKVVNVNRKVLLTRSIGLSAIAALYCTVWTIYDPPQSQTSLLVSEDKNDFGETIVSVSNYCDSNLQIWFIISFICQAFLLVGASVLAHQMRSAPNAVNDSAELAVMIYSSFIFLILRFVLYIFSGNLPGGSATLQKARSLTCSGDTIATIVIIFLRFFRKQQNKRPMRRGGFSVGSIRRSAMGSTRGNLTGLSSQPHVESARPSEATPSTEARYESESIRNLVENLNRRGKSEISLEEEKDEEDSTMIRFRTKDRFISFPKWAFEEYGELEQIIRRPSI